MMKGKCSTATPSRGSAAVLGRVIDAVGPTRAPVASWSSRVAAQAGRLGHQFSLARVGHRLYRTARVSSTFWVGGSPA